MGFLITMTHSSFAEVGSPHAPVQGQLLMDESLSDSSTQQWIGNLPVATWVEKPTPKGQAYLEIWILMYPNNLKTPNASIPSFNHSLVWPKWENPLWHSPFLDAQFQIRRVKLGACWFSLSRLTSKLNAGRRLRGAL